MTTQVPGTVAREYAMEMVHFLRRTITFSQRAQQVVVGTVPAGSVIVGGGATVLTAFNGTGTDLLDVGTVANDDGLATDLDLSTVGFKALDELTATTNVELTADTDIIATYADANSDSTAGRAVVTVMYIPNIDKQD